MLRFIKKSNGIPSKAALLALLALCCVCAPCAIAGRLALIGSADNFTMLSDEEQSAYRWAQMNFNASYVSWAALQADKSALDGFSQAWWHYDEATTLTAAASSANALLAVKSLLARGGGVLLSGFAPQYVCSLGLESSAPYVAKDPQTTSDWGFSFTPGSHEIFKNLESPLAIVSGGLAADNNVCWWPAAQLHGRCLADTDWQGGLATIGEYDLDAGKVMFAGTGAFEWSLAGRNAKRSNLQQITSNILRYLGASPGGEMLGWWQLEGDAASAAREEVSGASDPVANNFGKPEYAAGVRGKALRIDGYSTWVSDAAGKANTGLTGLTVMAWVAPWAYPFNMDAAIVNQQVAPAGFFMGLNSNGIWNFSLGVDGAWRACFSSGALTKFQWQHIAGTWDSATGITLYVNGVQAAQNSFSGSVFTPSAGTPLLIGRHNQAQYYSSIFLTGLFNGLVDDVKVYGRALSADEIYNESAGAAYGAADVIPPLSRLADDPQHPVYHPIPPADWTNECHGLVYWNGNYHLFYQYNPNGPYFGNQHWGHMHSPDLVRWTNDLQALWPGGSYDSLGTWTGDTINMGDHVAILYTSNESGQTQSLATSSDGLLTNWTKDAGNPVIADFPSEVAPIAGFRDPSVFAYGGYYYMVVGSGTTGSQGIALLYRSTDLKSWDYRGYLYSAAASVAGEMWEVPQFFPLGNDKWALIVIPVANSSGDARTCYWIGSFANERFTPDDAAPKLLESTEQFLAPSVMTDEKGRLIAIGMLREQRSSAAQLAAGWAQSFSIPRELYLSGSVLCQRPIGELSRLHDTHWAYENMTVTPSSSNLLSAAGGDALHIKLSADVSGARTFGLRLRRSPDSQEQTLLTFNRLGKSLVLNRANSSLSSEADTSQQSGGLTLDDGEALELEIFIDRSVIEIFANERTVLATRIYPTRSDSTGLDLFCTGGNVTVSSLDIWKMKAMSEASPASSADSRWELFE